MVTAEEWKGRTGQEWARQVAALDGMLDPVGLAAMDAMGPLDGLRVLDLGCGAGSTTLALAERGARVTGIDISPDLIATARGRLPETITLVQADAATATFPEPFDAIYSRCGAMFFADPTAAYSHLRSTVIPGGQITIAAWAAPRDNEWASVPMAAAKPLLPEAEPAPPGAPGPFAWADPDIFRPILEGAGWQGLSYQTIARPARISLGDDPDPATRAADFCLRIGRVASATRGADPDLKAAVRDRLIHAFQPFVKNDTVEVTSTAWLIQARA